MTKPVLSSQWLFLGCALLALALTTPAKADEDGDKGKGKGQKANIIQIDLSNLPPDLAKLLQKYATDSKKPDPKADKDSKDTKKPTTTAHLPPGLANKSADHPGRVAWLKEHSAAKQAAPPEKKKKNK